MPDTASVVHSDPEILGGTPAFLLASNGPEAVIAELKKPRQLRP